ncbi:MAG: metallophosphoesterase family protein [Bacteroidota bacterium]
MAREKITQSLGELNGPLLIFGGVYSNLQALQAMQEVASQQGFLPEQIICTGDVVGYCAQPEETVQAIRDWGISVILGNVEIQLGEGAEDCGCDFSPGGRCDLFSRQWYPYAQSQLSQASIDWMQGLPDFLEFSFSGKKALVVHGSYFEEADYVFASTPWSTKQANFEATQADVILAGHCGLPFHSMQDGKAWLNPGVIGMPANDGEPHVWYMILQETVFGWTFMHHKLTYDHQTAAKLMREKQLPLSYAQTLETGLWDNCEILPEAETQAQGKPLGLAR